MTDIREEIASLAVGRFCLCPPIGGIAAAAALLSLAADEHLAGNRGQAKRLIREADMQSIRNWTESIWGAKSPYLQFREVAEAPPVQKEIKERMPPTSVRAEVIHRDGYHCRFCGIPVIRADIRRKLHIFYPDALPWGRKNSEQHAAFQAMWAQYDHILPYSRGGSSEIDNLVLTCAPCNFGRMSHTLDEVGLANPRLRPPVHTEWDGLERLA
jgi:5-methylcytosine-specific restriction endonuclease McrA